MKTLIVLIISVFLIDVGYCAAPVLHGLPTSVNVGELEYKGRLIYELTVTDINQDSFVCNTRGVVPSPNNTNIYFRILIDSANGRYGVYLVNNDEGTSSSPNTMFDFNIEKTFTVLIGCTDSRNNTNNPLGYLEVDIIDNDRLEFTNLPDTITVDASTTNQGDSVYVVQARNLLTANDNGLTYSISTAPPSNSFDIDGNGKVYAKQNLIYENNTPITAYITVTDDVIWIREKLRIDLTKMNNIPEITNLKTSPSVHLSEMLTSGSVIYTLTGSDADATDTLTYTWSVDPVTDTGLFQLDTTTNPIEFKLAAGKTFDYEKTKYYNVTFKVLDGKATGGPFVLNVHILDENEPCYFDRSTYTLSTFEGTSGSINLNPGFIIRDNDGVNLPYSLSLLNGNGSERFTMDQSTGVINYATDYDIDGNAMPSTVYMLVKCQDETGETGTATVVLYIQDINDNAPVFSSSEYSFFADQFTGIGSLIGTTTATDIDSGINSKFDCRYGTTQNAIVNTYFTVGSDCSVFFTSRSGLAYDTVIRFTLLAVDKGTPQMTGTTYVNAIYRETSTTTISTSTTTTPTTTTTTTTAAPTTDTLSDGSIAAIVIGSLIGAVLLGLLLYMLFRWCYTGFCCGPEPCDFARCCRRGDYSNYPPRRQITPVRSRPALQDKSYRDPRDTADEFNYYRDDSDYGSMKNQDIRNSRFSRSERAYPDFPQVGEPQFPRLSPSDARVEMISPKYGPRIPAIGYR